MSKFFYSLFCSSFMWLRNFHFFHYLTNKSTKWMLWWWQDDMIIMKIIFANQNQMFVYVFFLHYKPTVFRPKSQMTSLYWPCNIAMLLYNWPSICWEYIRDNCSHYLFTTNKTKLNDRNHSVIGYSKKCLILDMYEFSSRIESNLIVFSFSLSLTLGWYNVFDENGQVGRGKKYHHLLV